MEINSILYLFSAIQQDDSISLQQIITNSINPNELITKIPPNNVLYGIKPFPILNIAASYGALSCVKLLLDYDVDVLAFDGLKNTALHCAAFSGNVEIIHVLLQFNCDPMISNLNSDLPIHIAASHNHNDAVLYLIETLANPIDVKNVAGYTPLLIAAQKNNLPLAQYLLNLNCDVTAVDNGNNNMLHIAVKNRSGAIAQFLVEQVKSLNINHLNYDGETALLISAKLGLFDFFRNLLEFGADPLIADKKGRSILHFAIKSKSYDMIDFILNKTVLSKHLALREDNFGTTPLHFAASCDDINIVRVVSEFDKGASINNSKCGLTPIQIAVKCKNLDAVNFFISNFKDADLLAENFYGQNVIHIAARSNDITLLSMFLTENRAKFDISIPDINGVLFFINCGLHFTLLLKKVLWKWLSSY